eukprot:COSAG03_NODE_2606_length_2598_cov_2.649860_2_plen_96_part_00
MIRFLLEFCTVLNACWSRYLLPQSLDGTNEAAPYTHTVDSDGRIDEAVGYGRVPQCTVHPRTRPGACCYVCCYWCSSGGEFDLTSSVCDTVVHSR